MARSPDGSGHCSTPLLTVPPRCQDNWRPTLTPRQYLLRVLKKNMKAYAVCMSHPWLVRMMTIQKAMLFALDPLLKAMVAYRLVLSSDYWWAGFTVSCLAAPVFILYALMNHSTMPGEVEERQSAFEREFGMKPGLGALLVVYFRVMTESVVESFRNSPRLTHSVQCFSQLSRLVASISEQPLYALLLLRIFVVKSGSDDDSHADMWTPASSMCTVAFNMHSAYDYFTTYSTLASGGYKIAFLMILLRLGKGAAPPLLLMQIRNQRDLVVEHDLSELDYVGAQSIFMALMTSQTLVTCQFINNHWSGIQDFNNFIMMVCGNEERLKYVSFTPSLTPGAEGYRYNCNGALLLDKIMNGDEVLYSRDARHPPSDLRAAVEANDAEACTAILCAGTKPTARDYHLAVALDHWRILALFLRESWPSSLIELIEVAAYFGGLACTQLLISCGAVVADARCNALNLAANAGFADIVSLLLKHGANINREHYSEYHGFGAQGPPLENVIWGGSNSMDTVKRLIAAKPSFDHLQCALRASAENNAASIAQLILNARASVNERDGESGETPLHIAARQNSAETIKTLLDARADMDLKDFQECSALETAVRYDATRAAAVLQQGMLFL